MSVLRNLEAKLGGLVEGPSGAPSRRASSRSSWRTSSPRRWRRTRWSPSRACTCPNHYRVFLSPEDREQFASYEPALRKELSDYLLEHARQERLALTSRPQVEFHTDERLELGEFGIQAQLLARPRRTRAASCRGGALGGRLRAHDGLLARPRGAPARAGARPPPGAAGGRGPAQRAQRRARGGRPQPRLRRRRVRPQRLAPPRRAAPRASDGWAVVDLGSTNGMKVNGRRVGACRAEPGDRITIGVTDLTFELD